MDLLYPIPFTIVLLAVVTAAITDAFTFRIHNSVTIPLIISGIAFHAGTEGLPGFLFSLGGIFFAICALIVPYLLGAMGAGDVKLLGGIGAWLGVWPTAIVFLLAALIGVLYSAIIMLHGGKMGDMLSGLRLAIHQLATLGKHLGTGENVGEVVRKPDRRDRLVPFAVMLAFALLVVLVWMNAK